MADDEAAPTAAEASATAGQPTTTSSSSSASTSNNLVDITDLITACASSLTMQEPFLCQERSFQLQDAMAATQLMDPKMDSCEVPAHLAAPLATQHHPTTETAGATGASATSTPSTAKAAKAKPILFPRPHPERLCHPSPDPFVPLPWLDLTIPQASIVVTHELIRLQALFTGASVGESVFTCIYAHKPMLCEMDQQLTNELDEFLVNVDETETTDIIITTPQERLAQHLQLLLEHGVTNPNMCARWSIFAATCAILEIAEVFRSIVINADIYEEEDFVSNTHDLQFFLLGQQQQQQQEQQQEENNAPHGGEQEDERPSEHSSSSNNNDNNNDKKKQTTLRQYLDVTVEVLRRLGEHDSNNNNKDNAQRSYRQHIQKLRLALTYLNGLLLFCLTMAKLKRSDLVETVDSMKTLVVSLCAGLQSLHNMASSSSSSSSSSPTATTTPSQDETEEERILLAKVFDSYINRPLFGNTPVRKVSFLAPKESLTTLLEITHELEWGVCGLLTHGNSLARIDRMLRRFTFLNILSRSLIVLNLYFDDRLLGKHDLQSLIVTHMRQWQHVPTEWMQPIEPTAAAAVAAANNGEQQHAAYPTVQHAQAFLGRIAKPIYDTLKLQISNRNRQRAYLEAAMFQEWTALQSEATIVDNHYRKQQQQQQQPNDDNINLQWPPVFGFYVLSVLLRLMDQHLTCGIEGGLFCGHHEICCAFWYRDFLLAALTQNLTQMRRGKEMFRKQQALQIQQQQALQQQQQAQQQQQQQQRTQPERSKGKKKNHHHKNKSHNNQHNGRQQQQQQPPAVPQPPPPPQKTLEEIEDGLEYQVLEAKRMLCRGIVRFIVAIRQAGWFPTPNYEFTSRRTIFDNRFSVFEAIRHPPPLSFDDYLDGTGQGPEGQDLPSVVSATEMCQVATDIFKSCRTLVESILADIGSIQVPYAPVQESEARALLKVCVGNSVYLMKLSQLLVAERGSSTSSTTTNGTATTPPAPSFGFDFGAHKEFCIVKLC